MRDIFKDPRKPCEHSVCRQCALGHHRESRSVWFRHWWSTVPFSGKSCWWIVIVTEPTSYSLQDMWNPYRNSLRCVWFITIIRWLKVWIFSSGKKVHSLRKRVRLYYWIAVEVLCMSSFNTSSTHELYSRHKHQHCRKRRHHHNQNQCYHSHHHHRHYRHHHFSDSQHHRHHFSHYNHHHHRCYNYLPPSSPAITPVPWLWCTTHTFAQPLSAVCITERVMTMWSGVASLAVRDCEVTGITLIDLLRKSADATYRGG